MGEKVQDSSIVTSISQLIGLEEDRRADAAARRAEAERQRAHAEHAARLAEEARQREEERRIAEQLRRRREELAKLEALTGAEVQRAKLEAGSRRQIDAALLNQRSAHALEVARLDARARRARLSMQLGVAVGLLLVAIGGWFGHGRIDRLELHNAQLQADAAAAARHAESSERKLATAESSIEALRRRLAAKPNGALPTTPRPSASSKAVPGAPRRSATPRSKPAGEACGGDPLCTSDLDL